ncbi:MAG: hypothetical protein R8G34_00095 [Paracoccaceae bacterium]|nr:hypothetical protein [Paracoccaceae bacterium]
MHIEAMPYADQLCIHADEIEMRVLHRDWEDGTPIRLEISVVYSAVIVRKLWEHYTTLLREVGFELDQPLPGLFDIATGNQQTGITFVHRIIHSKTIDTSEESKQAGLQFESDWEGKMRIAYADVIEFFRKAADACRAIHG